VNLSEQGVGRDRAGMRDEYDLRRGNFFEQRAQRVEQPFLRRPRRRRHLVPNQPPIVRQRDEVGERPPISMPTRQLTTG